jgi:hypothetical protein
MKLFRYQGENKPPVELSVPTVKVDEAAKLEEAKKLPKFKTEEEELEALRAFAHQQLAKTHPVAHKKYHNYD